MRRRPIRGKHRRRFLLGHAHVSTTMQIYTHVDEEARSRALTGFNDLLSRTASPLMSGMDVSGLFQDRCGQEIPGGAKGTRTRDAHACKGSYGLSDTVQACPSTCTDAHPRVHPGAVPSAGVCTHDVYPSAGAATAKQCEAHGRTDAVFSRPRWELCGIHLRRCSADLSTHTARTSGATGHRSRPAGPAGLARAGSMPRVGRSRASRQCGWRIETGR